MPLARMRRLGSSCPPALPPTPPTNPRRRRYVERQRANAQPRVTAPLDGRNVCNAAFPRDADVAAIPAHAKGPLRPCVCTRSAAEVVAWALPDRRRGGLAQLSTGVAYRGVAVRLDVVGDTAVASRPVDTRPVIGRFGSATPLHAIVSADRIHVFCGDADLGRDLSRRHTACGQEVHDVLRAGLTGTGHDQSSSPSSSMNTTRTPTTRPCVSSATNTGYRPSP